MPRKQNNSSFQGTAILRYSSVQNEAQVRLSYKGRSLSEDYAGTLQDMHSQCVLRYQIHIGTSAQSVYLSLSVPLNLRQDQVARFIFFFCVCAKCFNYLAAAVLVVWCRLVHDDLDHKVLLDLGVLQAGLVREELSREEPALVGQVNVLLSLKLFFQQADGVGHAGVQAQVFAGGEPYLQLELFLLGRLGLRVVRQVFLASFCDQVDRRGQAIHW